MNVIITEALNTSQSQFVNSGLTSTPAAEARTQLDWQRMNRAEQKDASQNTHRSLIWLAWSAESMQATSEMADIAITITSKIILATRLLPS